MSGNSCQSNGRRGKDGSVHKCCHGVRSGTVESVYTLSQSLCDTGGAGIVSIPMALGSEGFKHVREVGARPGMSCVCADLWKTPGFLCSLSLSRRGGHSSPRERSQDLRGDLRSPWPEVRVGLNAVLSSFASLIPDQVYFLKIDISTTSF